MKKNDTSIKRRIDDLVCKIDKQWGHNHLYNEYKVLVDALENNRNLSMLDVSALDELVVVLQNEATRYRGYPKWAIRCLECASELVVFLPSDFIRKEERVKRSAELLTSFITDPNLFDVLIHRDYYGKYIDDVSKYDVEMLAEIALTCFRGSAEGRRPWGIKEEIAFHGMMAEGYKQANKYLSLSSDFSHFPEWFTVLSPHRTDSLIEEVSKWIDNNEDVERKRWNHFSYDDVVGYLEDTLDKQLDLLRKWLDGDAEGFVDFWRAEKIEELLELVEDDVFFEILSKLFLLKNNGEVQKVLAFYAEDDELQIKSYALKLLADYH